MQLKMRQRQTWSFGSTDMSIFLNSQAWHITFVDCGRLVNEARSTRSNL
jgi:hypothetical protein